VVSRIGARLGPSANWTLVLYLGFCQACGEWWMTEAMEGSFDITSHGQVDHLSNVVPFDGETTIVCWHPSLC